MTKLDWKIALRTFLAGKGYHLLNITGLALGLAAFILATLYVDYEKSYDRWNTNVDRIFLVERELPNGSSPYTPGKLAAAIKRQCPEVEETGRINTAPFELNFFTSSGKFKVKKWLGADYSIAGMLGIQPKGFTLDPHSAAPTILLSEATARVLFPHDALIRNQTVSMVAKTGGIPLTLSGVAAAVPGNTNFGFDCIGFSDDITQGKDQSYANPIYQTFLLVRPGADIALLSRKIDQIYREAVQADSSRVAKVGLPLVSGSVYLDPLSDLHLKPHYGSSVNDYIVKGLTVLAILILVISGVNFTNLYLSQAARRSKEVGIKKINGVSRGQIIVQFLGEIFVQCLLALCCALVIVIIAIPYFNRLLGVDLLISGINLHISLKVLLSLIGVTALAGVYPSILMAGFRVAAVLRGDPAAIGGKLSWVRHAINVMQFTFAVSFVILLVVIHQQVSYMRSEDPGFQAKQVVCIDNLGIYNDPKKFEPVRNRIQALPGVKNVTVASHIPGGYLAPTYEYTVQSSAYALQTIGVDYDYFETLNISLREGELFSRTKGTNTSCAVINQTAAVKMGLKRPIGTVITGCNTSYRVIGVIKDTKAYGFEEPVQPTIYLMGGGCGLTNTQIMISAGNEALPRLLQTLGKEWSTINALDGDNFNYRFLDDVYGRLFIKQDQLRSVLYCFSLLAVFIVSLGLFASAANAIRVRRKEIAIRKVLGAAKEQLTITLSKPFIFHVLIANLIAWPISLLIATEWLNTFVYRIQLTVVPFVLALVVSGAIVAVTVVGQMARAVRFSPAGDLKV